LSVTFCLDIRRRSVKARYSIAVCVQNVRTASEYRSSLSIDLSASRIYIYIKYCKKLLFVYFVVVFRPLLMRECALGRPVGWLSVMRLPRTVIADVLLTCSRLIVYVNECVMLWTRLVVG